MAKGVKEFVRGFDVAASVFKALANAIADAGGTDEDIRRIETNSNLRKQIAELVVKGKKAVGDVVRLLVDYTRPLAELIKDGRFDYVNSDITEKHFPINRKTNVEVETKVFSIEELVGTTRNVTSKEVIQALKDKGYREAELPELLAYAKNHPDEQRKYPIVGLGSVWQSWHGDRSVPYLWNDGGKRSLDLYWYDSEWGEYDWFLAVRKS